MMRQRKKHAVRPSLSRRKDAKPPRRKRTARPVIGTVDFEEEVLFVVLVP
jgi:hypothetical protein